MFFFSIILFHPSNPAFNPNHILKLYHLHNIVPSYYLSECVGDSQGHRSGEKEVGQGERENQNIPENRTFSPFLVEEHWGAIGIAMSLFDNFKHVTQ